MSKITSKQIDDGDAITLYRIRCKATGQYRSKRGWGGSETGSVFASIGHAKNHMNQCFRQWRNTKTKQEFLVEHEIVAVHFEKKYVEVIDFV